MVDNARLCETDPRLGLKRFLLQAGLEPQQPSASPTELSGHIARGTNILMSSWSESNFISYAN